MALVKGTAYWARVFTPDTMFEPKWCLDLEVSEADAKVLEEAGLTRKEAKDGVDGIRFQFKRKVETSKGEKKTPPIIVDKHNKRTKEAIGNGSEVLVQYRTYEWEYKKKSGIGVDLQGVKVLTLVPYAGADGTEFGDIQDDLDEDNPFA